MATFQAVNTTTLTAPDPPQARPGEETTPTTPRPNANFFPQSRPADDPRAAEDPSAKTPTRNSFASGLAAQRPLPTSPFTPQREISETPSHKSHDSGKGALTRESSHRSTQSVGSHDVEMGGEDDGSDNESVTSDVNRPSKKKKGQRFFCTDFPPCQLSFTRSEHLARHIRKHTGERPFQCHCSRRFSRLDNLRQHAQTVHVNEDIPGDSLAATGTRFQRQIRTERVRPQGRSRASTLGSQGGHSRGHSRNLSASSITSTASTISMSQPQDVRRRPPPLAMASDPAARARMSLNTLDAYNPPLMGSPGPQIVDYTAQSTGATTPTSATFPTATGSPSRYPSGLQSPVSNASRPVSWAGSRTPGRRLSVPAAANNPFSGTPGQIPPPYITPLPSATSSTFSGQSSAFGSPISSQFSESRRESNADSDWRRRTWHPGTYAAQRPPTSGLGFQQTPDAPRPTYTSQPAASQTTRLPGIESFDHAPPPPSLALPRRQPSPMQIDTPTTRPATYHAPSDSLLTVGHEKRKSISWDTTLQRGINRLEIASPHPPREHWSSPYQGSPGQSAVVRPTTAPHPSYYNQQQPLQHHQRHVPQPIQIPPMEPPRMSQEPPVTPRKNKRQAWYNGPLAMQQQQQQQPPVPQQQHAQPMRVMQRTSPEDSSSSEGIPTPSSSSMTEYHPAIVHSNGMVEPHPPGVVYEENKPGLPTSIMDRPHPVHQQYRSFHSHSLSSSAYQPQREPERRPVSFGQPLPQNGGNDMRRLEALVAVATGEQQAVGNRG